jgi:microcystin-dependent protein
MVGGVPDINPSIPIIGQPDATEEPKVVTALSQLIAAVNDVDSDQIQDGAIALVDLATAIQQMLPKTGDLKLTAYGTADDGWLVCDGALVSRATYAPLFAKIGTAYGAGDGSTNFALPDLRGRVPVGLGTHASVDALGDNDGTAVANRTPQHWHDADNLTANLLSTNTGGGASTVASRFNANGLSPTYLGGVIDVIGDVGNTAGTQDAPSFVVVNYQIKT